MSGVTHMSDLAKRAVACAGWRWVPGMLVAGIGALSIGMGRVVDVSAAGFPVYRDGYGRLQVVPGALPDFADPATCGCLLALVREAWGDERLHITPPARDRGHRFASPDWITWKPRTHPTMNSVAGRGATEAEALVAALEAAPQ